MLLVPFIPAAGAPAASPETPLTLTGDRLEYNSETHVVTAEGNVRASGQGAVLTADHLEANLQTGDAVATGHVTLVRGSNTSTGSYLRYNFRTQEGRMEQVESQYGPWHLTASSMDLAEGAGTALDATMTSCDPAHPFYKVAARRVVVVPNDSLIAYDAQLYVEGAHVATLPVYRASLKPRKRQTSPTVGYNPLDGAYIDYATYFPLGSLTDTFRVRLATMTGLSGENILTIPGPDHEWDVVLGRTQVFDQNGNPFNVDRYAVELFYASHRFGTLPVSYALEGSAGSYTQAQPAGASTTRFEGSLTLASDSFVLTPRLTAGASGRIIYDAYGTGQQRLVVQGSAALTASVTAHDYMSLSYTGTSVGGSTPSTPFQFDFITPDSSVTLAYIHTSAGLLQTFVGYVSYDNFTMQTTLGGSLSFNISPSLTFVVSPQYNLTIQQWAEIDYSLTVHCDCVTVGLLYRTFPQTPANNQLFITFNLAGVTTAPPQY